MPKTETGRIAPGRHRSRPPDAASAEALSLEASALVDRGEADRGLELYRQATRIDPHLAGAWLGLGIQLKQQRDFAEGFRCLLRAIAEADRKLRKFPGDRPSHVARGMAYTVVFHPREAVRSFRRALEMAPDIRLHSQVIYLLSFLPETTPEALYAEAGRFHSIHAAHVARPVQRFANLADPGRRLKIGYVSPDLCEHPVMKFLPPVLESHDRAQFSVTVYSASRKTDARTAEVAKLVDSFVPCLESGRALDERIRADEIDILVDLAGHTMPLEYYWAFARKAAPIQVNWMGFLSTTGLQTMDYFLGNAEMPCPGTEPCFSETVYRLPRVPYCYRAAVDAALTPTPWLERGYITFGSFNGPNKIGREVVKVWAEILRRVPQSRILMKYWSLDTKVMRDRYQGWFRKEGIAGERIEFEGPAGTKEYLAAYSRIDIALDPFPYQGGATTMDTLWMGVPMVAMDGRLAVQRASTTALKSVGLPDTIASSPEQYVKAAVFLAGIVGRIPGIRRNIRKAFQSSAYMDEAGFTRELEAAYRDMWRIWCRKQADGGGARPGT